MQIHLLGESGAPSAPQIQGRQDTYPTSNSISARVRCTQLAVEVTRSKHDFFNFFNVLSSVSLPSLDDKPCFYGFTRNKSMVIGVVENSNKVYVLLKP